MKKEGKSSTNGMEIEELNKYIRKRENLRKFNKNNIENVIFRRILHRKL